MTREWRKIPGFDEEYEVSNDGLVRTFKRYQAGRLLTPSRGGYPGEYPRVGLLSAGKSRIMRLHDLVTRAFLGPKPKGYWVRHLDGNPLNNRIENLRYGLPVENAADTERHGRRNKGSRNGNASITEETAAQIKALLTTATPREVVEKLGVSKGIVNAIAYGATWKHVHAAQEGRG